GLERRAWKSSLGLLDGSARGSKSCTERGQRGNSGSWAQGSDERLEALCGAERTGGFWSNCSALSRKASTHGTDRRKSHRHVREIFGGRARSVQETIQRLSCPRVEA